MCSKYAPSHAGPSFLLRTSAERKEYSQRKSRIKGKSLGEFLQGKNSRELFIAMVGAMKEANSRLPKKDFRNFLDRDSPVFKEKGIIEINDMATVALKCHAEEIISLAYELGFSDIKYANAIFTEPEDSLFVFKAVTSRPGQNKAANAGK